MAGKRKVYAPEFKLAAVKMITEGCSQILWGLNCQIPVSVPLYGISDADQTGHGPHILLEPPGTPSLQS